MTAAAGAPLTLWQRGGEDGYSAIVRFAPATAFSTSRFAEVVSERWARAR